MNGDDDVDDHAHLDEEVDERQLLLQYEEEEEEEEEKEEDKDTLAALGREQMTDGAEGQPTYPVRFEGHAQWVLCAVFSPDGELVATASYDGTAKLWDLRGELLRTFEGHTKWVRGVAFSPNGDLLATASYDGTARLWSALSGELLRTLAGHSDSVLCVAFSPDGRQVATASADRTLRLWTVPEGQPLLTVEAHSDWVRGVAFSPDGRLVATASDDKTVKLWSVPTGENVLTVGGHLRGVWSVSFSPNCQWVASASHDGTVKLWSVADGALLRTLQARSSAVVAYCASFSPDGRLLATACDDGTVKQWDASTGELMWTFRGHMGPARSVAYSPDGRMLATASDDMTAMVAKSHSALLVAAAEGNIGRQLLDPSDVAEVVEEVLLICIRHGHFAGARELMSFFGTTRLNMADGSIDSSGAAQLLSFVASPEGAAVTELDLSNNLRLTRLDMSLLLRMEPSRLADFRLVLPDDAKARALLKLVGDGQFALARDAMAFFETTQLNMSGRNIDNGGAEQLLSFVASPEGAAVTELDLSQNRLLTDVDAGLRALLEAAEPRRLAEFRLALPDPLVLDMIVRGDYSLARDAMALCKTTRLRVADCGIDNSQAAQLFSFVVSPEGATVTELDLSNNHDLTQVDLRVLLQMEPRRLAEFRLALGGDEERRPRLERSIKAEYLGDPAALARYLVDMQSSCASLERVQVKLVGRGGTGKTTVREAVLSGAPLLPQNVSAWTAKSGEVVRWASLAGLSRSLADELASVSGSQLADPDKFESLMNSLRPKLGAGELAELQKARDVLLDTAEKMRGHEMFAYVSTHGVQTETRLRVSLRQDGREPAMQLLRPGERGTAGWWKRLRAGGDRHRLPVVADVVDFAGQDEYALSRRALLQSAHTVTIVCVALVNHPVQRESDRGEAGQLGTEDFPMNASAVEQAVELVGGVDGPVVVCLTFADHARDWWKEKVAEVSDELERRFPDRFGPEAQARLAREFPELWGHDQRADLARQQRRLVFAVNATDARHPGARALSAALGREVLALAWSVLQPKAYQLASAILADHVSTLKKERNPLFANAGDLARLLRCSRKTDVFRNDETGLAERALVFLHDSMELLMTERQKASDLSSFVGCRTSVLLAPLEWLPSVLNRFVADQSHLHLVKAQFKKQTESPFVANVPGVYARSLLLRDMPELLLWYDEEEAKAIDPDTKEKQAADVLRVLCALEQCFVDELGEAEPVVVFPAAIPMRDDESHVQWWGPRWSDRSHVAVGRRVRGPIAAWVLPTLAVRLHDLVSSCSKQDRRSRPAASALPRPGSESARGAVFSFGPRARLEPFGRFIRVSDPDSDVKVAVGCCRNRSFLDVWVRCPSGEVAAAALKVVMSVLGRMGQLGARASGGGDDDASGESPGKLEAAAGDRELDRRQSQRGDRGCANACPPLCPFCLYRGVGSPVDVVDGNGHSGAGVRCSSPDCGRRVRLDLGKVTSGASLPLSEAAFDMIRDHVNANDGALIAHALGLRGVEEEKASQGGIHTANVLKGLGYLTVCGCADPDDDCSGDGDGGGGRERPRVLADALEKEHICGHIAPQLCDLLGIFCD